MVYVETDLESQTKSEKHLGPQWNVGGWGGPMFVMGWFRVSGLVGLNRTPAILFARILLLTLN